MKRKEGRKKRKRKSRTTVPACPSYWKFFAAIARYIYAAHPSVQQNTIGETGQRRVKKWWRRRWGRRKKRVDGARGRRSEEEEEEEAREDEKDAEVMAVVAAEVSGGSFYKKSGRERGPFRRRDRGARGRTKRRRTGVASER